MWSALCFGGVWEGVRDGLDSQVWIMILHAVSTMLTVVSWCENSVPGLDYLIAAHGKSRSTGLDVFGSYKETAMTVLL